MDDNQRKLLLDRFAEMQYLSKITGYSVQLRFKPALDSWSIRAHDRVNEEDWQSESIFEALTECVNWLGNVAINSEFGASPWE